MKDKSKKAEKERKGKRKRGKNWTSTLAREKSEKFCCGKGGNGGKGGKAEQRLEVEYMSYDVHDDARYPKGNTVMEQVVLDVCHEKHEEECLKALCLCIMRT